MEKKNLINRRSKRLVIMNILNTDDYILLIDIHRRKDRDDHIRTWMRNTLNILLFGCTVKPDAQKMYKQNHQHLTQT